MGEFYYNLNYDNLKCESFSCCLNFNFNLLVNYKVNLMIFKKWNDLCNGIIQNERVEIEICFC